MKKRHLRIVPCIIGLGALWFTLDFGAMARPEWRQAKDFPEIFGIKRNALVVVSNTGTADNPRFKLFLPTVVPMTKGGQIKWFSDDSWRSEPISGGDQILIEDKYFGANSVRSLRLAGCLPSSGIRIKSQEDPKNKEAFLVWCEDSILRTVGRPTSPIRYDIEQGFIESDSYFYKFKTKNHMLFDMVDVKQADGSRIELARDADLMIRADVKKFFNMQFNSTDIESRMKSSRPEVVGAFATVGFYLKILFFKIAMDLDTDVKFFRNSAHIPMVLTTPVNARKRLNERSGILYSFELGRDLELRSNNYTMPYLSDRKLPIDEGLSHCQGDICSFFLEFGQPKIAASNFQMELKIPKKLVELGFFPLYVQDVNSAAPYMKWSFSGEHKLKQRVGIYLEVSGLSEGEHPWDFWMEFKS